MSFSCLVPPRNIMKWQSVNGSVREGEMVKLTCETDSANPAASITWTRDGHDVTERAAPLWSAGADNGWITNSTLVINATRSDNSKAYECSVIYDGREIGSLRGKFTLNVICEQRFINILLICV